MTIGKMENPVRGFLHGTAAAAAVVGTVALVLRASSTSAAIGGLVFGMGLFAVYLTSSLYHSVPWAPLNKRRMQRADHAMVFVLIAGTYTPVALLALDGLLQFVTLGGAWLVAAVGIGQHVVFPRSDQRWSIVLASVMGWLAVGIVYPMSQAAGSAAVALMVLGGVFYFGGMLMMVSGRPKLWPNVFSAHELFHVFTIVAGVLHFVATYRYFVPLG